MISDGLHDYFRGQCDQVFNEDIDFGLEASVPDPKSFDQKLRDMLEIHEAFLQAREHAIGNRYGSGFFSTLIIATLSYDYHPS